MSTKKNGAKTFPKRQTSTDRRNAKKEEEKTKTKDETRFARAKKPLKLKTPTTPPSARVVKTQFFPNKKMYSNALGTEKLKTSPVASTSKVAKAPDTSERPRTATLKKGTIINDKYKVGPEPEPDYEDDFESYESDFEEYHSESEISSTESEPQNMIKPPNSGTDDERKLDSGNYELPVPEFKHKQILDNIKESIEKENATIHLASLPDEGFEDGKSLQFLNFLGAQRKYKHRKSMEKMHKRGKEILSMIKLDIFNFTLLDFSPVPYDVFIQNFGKTNSVQIATQTGDDDISEETQTEEIKTDNKWTQFPVVIPKLEVPNEQIYRCNYLGVGTDEFTTSVLEVNDVNLGKFLTNAGNLILNLQTESYFSTNSYNNSTKIPFSSGYVLFDMQKQKILKERAVIDVCFSLTNKIATIHEAKEDKSLVCLWNISESEPEAILNAFGQVTCCAFALDFVVGGLQDGNIAVWNFKDSNPTFLTGIEEGHNCPLVSVISSTDSSLNLFEANQTTRICSLDEEGELIVWSLLTKPSTNYWNSVILVVNTKISLSKLHPEVNDFKCTHLAVNHSDSNHLFVSTNYGFVFHCLANGARMRKLQTETLAQANFIEVCPFSPVFVVVGFDDGIRFYSRKIEKPLITLANKETSEERVEMVQWSRNKPFVFYAKDAKNIHVWDLKASDIFPIYSVPFKEEIVCMKVSPGFQESYMAIATRNGLIYLCLLDSDGHGKQPGDQYQEDVKQFLNYINRYV